MDKESYAVCDVCSVGLANDDWTSIDSDSQEFEHAMTMVEVMGNVDPTDEKVDGYGECFICDDIVIDPQIWERA